MQNSLGGCVVASSPPEVRSYIGFFFFQAEDGIRDDLVTGVQTCALPIFLTATSRASDTMPDFPSRENDEWDEQKQQPREFLPLHNHHGNRENEGEQLLEGLS